MLGFSTVPRAISFWGLTTTVSAPCLQPYQGCCRACPPMPCAGQGASCRWAQPGANLLPRAVPPGHCCAPTASLDVCSPTHVLEQELRPGQGGLPAASGQGIQSIFPRPLLTCWKQVCYALWTAPLSHNLHRPSCYLVPKVPHGHYSPTEPITPPWALSQPRIGCRKFLSHVWLKPMGTRQRKSRLKCLTGSKAWCEGSGQGQALENPESSGRWDGAEKQQEQ